MIINYIKRRTAKAIVAMVDYKIESLRKVQEQCGNNDALFLRSQFKINSLSDLKTKIQSIYKLKFL